MGVYMFNDEAKNLTDDAINGSYAMYLHKFIEDCDGSVARPVIESSAIMSYDEFKEYYILKVLGRSSEFTANIARDYQYLSFDNFVPTNNSLA